MRVDAHQTLAGQALDSRFLAVSRLDRGGFGAVYEGVDRETGQVVALKVLHPHLSSDAKHVARLRREAEVIAGLDHPHVVRVFGFFEPEGAPAFLAMELLNGQSLQERLRVAGPMTGSDAAIVLDQLLDALDAVHRCGVVHRDLKPGNVFLVGAGDEPPRVKLLDFGVAKMVDGDTADRLTRTGVVIGTPRYMAPEQALAQPVGPHTDVWAAGLVAYAMLTGRPPWSGRSGIDITRGLLDAQPVPLDGLGPPVPAPVVSLVQRAVAKDPQGRFVDAGAMRRALHTGEVAPLEASRVTSPQGLAAVVSRPPTGEGTAETAIERPGRSAGRSGAAAFAPDTVASVTAPATVASEIAPATVASATAPATLASATAPVASAGAPAATPGAPPAVSGGVDAVQAPATVASAPLPTAPALPRPSGRWRVFVGCAAAGVLIGGGGAAAAVLLLGGEPAPVDAEPTLPSIEGPLAVAPLPLDPTTQQPMMPATALPGTAAAPATARAVTPSASDETGADARAGRAAAAGDRAVEPRSDDPSPSPPAGDEAPDPEPAPDPGQSTSVTVSADPPSPVVVTGRPRGGPPAAPVPPHIGPIDGASVDSNTGGPGLRYAVLSSGSVSNSAVRIRIMPKLPRIRQCWATAGLTRGARLRQVATLYLDPIGRSTRVQVTGDPRGASCVEAALSQIGFTPADAGQEIRLHLSSL